MGRRIARIDLLPAYAFMVTFEALHDVNLSVRDNEFICLLGPSSCGKTTLLRIMAGLERPNSDEILLDGVPIDGPVPPEVNGISGGLLFPWMTVLDDVAFGLKLQCVSKRDRYEKAQCTSRI
jgi:NitT/TauT family transport system ATP-binding protein